MKNNDDWVKGACILGISFFIAILLVKPIGVSTQFSVLSGIIHSKIDKNVIVEDSERESGYSSTNEYYDRSEGKLAKAIKKPLNYDFVFVLSIPIGGVLGYMLLKNKEGNVERHFTMDKDVCKVEKDKKDFFDIYIKGFIGGFLLIFGARMADGCTSGHMMSGIMQGSISGYVFAIVVFAIAIPTAIITKKFSRK